MTYKKDQRDFTEFLQDILDAIDDVEGFIKGMEFNEFSDDKKTISLKVNLVELNKIYLIICSWLSITIFHPGSKKSDFTSA